VAKYRVTFLPINTTVEVEEGTSILDAALKHDIALEHNCGGNCACATCHVIIREGLEYLNDRSEEEEDQLEDAENLTARSRLSCQTKIAGPVVVVIPGE